MRRRSFTPYVWMLVLVALLAGGRTVRADANGDAKKKVTVARLVINGSYPEFSDQAGLIGDLQTTLPRLIERLGKAAEDDDVSAVILRVEAPALGLGKANEVRAAITRLRESGKKVYAYSGALDTSGYLLASACDEVVMPSGGIVILPGIHAEFSFYKGMLGKLGVEADFIQMGKYKGAAEPFTRDTLSEASREQWKVLLDDYYAGMLDAIGTSRGLKPAQVRKAIDAGLLTGSQAKKAGLVDRIAYEDELREAIKKAAGADELAVSNNYGKKKVDTDFSLMTFMKLFTGTSGTPLGGRGNKIAVVYAVGPIISGKGGSGLMGDPFVGDRTLVAALRKAADNDAVKAIVLRVDSPGGSAIASDFIWRETQRIEKPIVASMGNVAASGGYYISMGCDKIYAEPDTLTGSIGVIGGKFALGGLYDKLGITTETMTRGKNSGIFSSTTRFSDGEKEAFVNMMKEIYREFVAKAAAGRDMEYDDLEALAQGRVWSGRTAKAKGLVDELGTLEDAIREAKQLAGLKPDAEVDILNLPKPKTFFEQLLDSSDASLKVKLDVGAVPAALRNIEPMTRILNERVMLMLPYHVQLK